MTTATQTQMTQANGSKEERSITYTPLGENAPITLSVPIVRRFIACKTRSGKTPDDTEIYKFIMLCKARELNPWVGDAYLVGYDSQDGPVFNLITAVQAFYKRAELNRNYDGMESGVSILKEDGTIEDRQGDFLMPKETLVGAWAKVYRKDQKIPMFDRLNLQTYSTGKSRWRVDPAGMITKCAEASALRRAFPNQLSALYLAAEMERSLEGDSPQPEAPKRIQATGTRTEQLAQVLAPEPEAYPDHGDAGEESQEVPFSVEDESQEPLAESEPESQTLGSKAMELIDRIGRAETKEALQAAWGDANQLKLAAQLSEFEFAEIKKEKDAVSKKLKK